MNQPMKFRSLSALAMAIGVAPVTAIAQTYPSQPLELVAHTAPGGGTDQFVRLMAEIFTREKLVSQAPTVSNRVGGGGAIAYTGACGDRRTAHGAVA